MLTVKKMLTAGDNLRNLARGLGGIFWYNF